MDKKSKAGIYLRISRDEENSQESTSIANQREMLRNFADARDDIEIIDEYVDDGHTGYDFEREGFQRMMQDAKSGRIDCIIVKDFSRLGRNYQKTEEYMQRTFPKGNIRFLAVANCYDSFREQSAGERLATPVINLLNEYHVMETSQKVRNVLEHHRKCGKFIGNHAPYGYLIENNALVVDEEAAVIVRRIFKLRIQGYSQQTIAEMLNLEGVKSPLEHKIERGIAATGEHLRDGNQAEWSSNSIRRILENPVYIGTLVQGKTTSASYRDKRRFKRDLSELDQFEDAHEAIVSETAFFIVEDLLGRDSYSSSQKMSYLFSNFAFCGSCGGQLYHRQDGKTKPVYWLCKNKECNCKQSIREDVLIHAVQVTLKMHMQMVIEQDSSDIPPNHQSTSKTLKELETKVTRLESSLNSLENKLKQAVISEEDYQEMKEYYSFQITGLNAEIAKSKKREDRLLACSEEIRNKYAEFYDLPELTREIIVTFIERIDVKSKTDISIKFRYRDIFRTTGDADGA